jgi:2-dehydro-3-deoxyphosphogluconate aldolase / (4S)-4-hydroxy-2-oxoglutarate aldolase
MLYTPDSKNVMETIATGKIIAIIRLPDLSNAAEIVRALLDGGIRAVEFTLSNPAAPTVIEELKKTFPEFTNGWAVIGAGTILNAGQADMVIASGAQFVVAPNTNFSVIQACNKQGIPVIPGAFTPTEIQAAWESGANAVKVFPIRSLGASYIRDVLNPLPHVRLIPTGGVNLANIAALFEAGVYAVGITSDLVNRKLAESHDYAQIKVLAMQYLELAANAPRP